MNKDYYKLRILLQFYEQEDTVITITALSKMFNLGKTYISKMIHELAEEELVDISDNRRPCLTQKGIEKAAMYSVRVQINLNRLLSEGVNPKDAMNDACIISLYCSEVTNSDNSESYRLYRAKQQLRSRKAFTGDELCRYLSDGQYNLNFILYKTKDREKSSSILSMSNAGFEQPCILTVEGGVGTFSLKTRPMVFHSKIAEQDISGKAGIVRYQDGNKFFPTEHIGDMFVFPASAVRFQTIASGDVLTLHGFIRLSMQADFGIMYMPQSTAICTFLI